MAVMQILFLLNEHPQINHSSQNNYEVETLTKLAFNFLRACEQGDGQDFGYFALNIFTVLGKLEMAVKSINSLKSEALKEKFNDLYSEFHEGRKQDEIS